MEMEYVLCLAQCLTDPLSHEWGSGEQFLSQGRAVGPDGCWRLSKVSSALGWSCLVGFWLLSGDELGKLPIKPSWHWGWGL